MNEKQFSWSYKASMDTIRGTDEEKIKATCLFDCDQSLVRKTINKRRTQGIAATVFAFVSIFMLGGVTVWAMTSNFSFRDFFFKNSEKEFEEVYFDTHKEYVIGEYKIICEGYIYDEAVESGIINFSFWDAKGKPVEMSDNISLLQEDIGPSAYTDLISAFDFKVGVNEGYLLISSVSDVGSFMSGNSLFITFSRMDLDKPSYKMFEDKYLKYLLLDRDEYQSLKKEIAALDDEKLFSYEQDPNNPSQFLNYSFDYNLAQSELENVLRKYDLHSLESKQFKEQIIQVDGFKLTVGRTNLVMEYNEKERTIESFTMIRANGTRIDFKLDEEYVDSRGNLTDTRINWIVDSVDKNGFSFGIGNLNGDIKISCNYGFILGKDEKITIEANGHTYQ